MSMRKQLYEWNINRQVNGFPLTDPSQGTTFEQIAGIPFSIFTGGIGNNITMPAATTATQFVTIDSVRGSPSYFLSGAAVLGVYNTAASAAFDTTALARNTNATFTGGITSINTAGVPGAALPIATLPAPTSNTGTGSGADFQLRLDLGGTGPIGSFRVNNNGTDGGSGYQVGDVLTWDEAAIVSSSLTSAGSITGVVPGGSDLIYTIQASDLESYTNQTEIPYQGSAANPAYVPGYVAPTTPPREPNPVLSFQTTHVNPYTSIAGPLMFMQVVINTTSYFDETDGTVGPGLPGSSSPYPETSSMRASFDFETPIYILPGQQWDVKVTVYNDSRNTIGDPTRTYNYTGTSGSVEVTEPEDLQCLVQYTLYDGPDALIATKLVEMGVAVRPENVDWYKRQLLEGTI